MDKLLEGLAQIRPLGGTPNPLWENTVQRVFAHEIREFRTHVFAVAYHQWREENDANKPA